MPSQLGIVENLSVLLPAPELGHSHGLLLHLFFETGALHWVLRSLAYMYTHTHTHRDILVIGLGFEII